MANVAELKVTYQDLTSSFRFSFQDFPFVTIRRLKQIVSERHEIEKGVPLRIFRVLSRAGSPQLFEELANNGTFEDYNLKRGSVLVASVAPLAVAQKNLQESEMEQTIHVFNWVPSPGTGLVKMQRDIREVFESFGPIFRIIISSLTAAQDEYTAIITFETREAARSAAAAMQLPDIVKALQEVTVLNKEISVYTAVRDNRTRAYSEDAASNDQPKEGDSKKDVSAEVQDINKAGVAPGSAGEESPDGGKGDDKEEGEAEGDVEGEAQAQDESKNGEDDGEGATTETKQVGIHAHALAMAKNQLIHGYLDGRQGVALIKWTAEPVPLRAKMGKPHVQPVSKRVKDWASVKAKVVGNRVQGAARGALAWFRKTTDKENMKAVRKKMATAVKTTARNVGADIKTAAKVVKTTAVKATDGVKARLKKNNKSSREGTEEPASRGKMPPVPSTSNAESTPTKTEGEAEEDVVVPTRSPEQEFFLAQAAKAAEAAAAAGSDSNADSETTTESPKDAAAHLTFDDI